MHSATPAGRRRPPTISDVAKAAGVSLPTVSRVLTGATPVRPVTRERVLLAMKQLGYRPNGAARALVRGQQPIVGVITSDASAYGKARMLSTIEERARQHGYVVAVTILDPVDLLSTPAALDVLLSQPIVGVIVVDYPTYDSARLHTLLGEIPVSTIANGVETDIDVPHVRIDDREGAREVTRHLLSLGHETVHHVAVPPIYGRPHPRELGWRDALLEAGAPVPPVVSTDWSIESGRAAGLELARRPGVTAVFCSNDELAFGVMRSLHESGRRVPDDVSVAGIDDEPLAATWVPSLTSFHLDWDWAGSAAFALLEDSVDGLAPLGQPRAGLEHRESTAPPAPRNA